MPGLLILSLFLSWVQVSSDTYVVKSSAGEDRAKRVLKELEGFHQLVGTTLVFRNTTLPELPIEVLVVGDEATMRELEPEYNGRRVEVAGYFQAGPDRDFIVLSGRVFPQTLTSVVYHELTHYFLARGLRSRPVWLNEGLAEYFSTAEVRDDEISLGGIYPDRLQLLKSNAMMPLKDFLAVDTTSPHYNESSKANMFYAQAWAFAHYLMHGEHAARFRQYVSALQKGDADLLAFLGVSERELESGFNAYVRMFLQRATHSTVKAPRETPDIRVEPIEETDAQMSIAEIFLANGKLDDARRHLEGLAAQAPDSTRVSYYRGVLAKLAGDSAGARDFFVDALLDPFLAPRAAVQLVDSGDMAIPSVRTTLEEAAAAGTRNPEVYLALGKIYAEEVRKIEENVRLSKEAADVAPARTSATQPASAAEELTSYMRGGIPTINFELRAHSDKQPRVRRVVMPYYPPELLDEKISGEVVMDLQVTPEGKAAGVWLVSSVPDVFATLATASVRDWEFEPIEAKIRVVLTFTP